MSHSQAESSPAVCAACGEAVSAEVWVVVDVEERPDLLGRIRDDTLHRVDCPRCGEAVKVDAPLLVYRPDPPLVLFSPAQGTSEAQDHEVMLRLAYRLHDRLQDEGREIPGRPRSVARERVAQTLDDPAVVRTPAPPEASDPLFETLRRFQLADDWTEAGRILDQNPALLTGKADRWLGGLIDLARGAGNEPMAADLQETRRLLRRAREVGVETALAEKSAGLGPDADAEGEALLRRLSRDDEPGDLQRRGDLIQRALGRIDREAQGPIWAGLLYELGRTYQAASEGDPSKRLEAAIHCFEQAAEVYVREGLLEQWARLQLNLGRAWAQVGPYEALAEAVRRYRRAQEVFTREAFPGEWETAELGIARAEREAALKSALDRYVGADDWRELRQVLEADRELLLDEDAQSLLSQLAAASRARGDAEGERLFVQRLELLQQCRAVGVAAAFGEAAGEAAPAETPELATFLQVQARLRRIQELGRRSQIPERIALYEEALALVDRQEETLLWAALQEQYDVHLRADLRHELGKCWAQNPVGDRAENTERAIRRYREALELTDREEDPVSWATVQNSLALGLKDRARGVWAENLEEAIEHARLALEVFTRKSHPEHWAGVHVNLANMYSDRIEKGRSGNLELAIAHARSALRVYSSEGAPVEWASAHVALGGAFSSRLEGDPADNLTRAARHYARAHEAFTRERHPDRWADVHNNAGNVYKALLAHDRRDAPRLAADHYRQALEVFTLEALPFEHRRTQRNLGDLRFEEGDWRRAHAAYAAAIEAGSALLAGSYTETGRRAEIEKNAALHVKDAYCLLRLGRPGEALLRLERGKTRLLSEALALDEAGLAALPGDRLEEVQAAWNAVRELEAEVRLPPAHPRRRGDRELSAALRAARTDLGRLVDAARAEAPGALTADLTVPELLALAPPEGALVAPLVTSRGGAVFVLPAGRETVGDGDLVYLDDFRQADLEALLLGPDPDVEVGGWVAASVRQGTDPDAWLEAIEGTARTLWDEVIGPVCDRLAELELENGAPVLLMPQGGLGLLPLHAAWREVDGAPRAFLDDYTVSYAPSGHAQSVSRRRLQERALDEATLVAVVDPTEDLDWAADEGDAVAELFPPDAVRSLSGAAATSGTVIEASPGASYLHFCCHGSYTWRSPLDSGLELAGGEVLTLARILAEVDLDSSRLVTLSACETGISDIRQSPDEYLGLPAGFFQAGAPAVASTLWEVDDLSTMLLMERFYRGHLRGGLPPAAALRAAQLWLRDVTRHELGDLLEDEELAPDARPFAHPFYWAAFSLSGA